MPRLTDRDNRAALQELLRKATPSYAAQPYQQLAAAYRSEGHDADARAVLMQQRRDQLDRGALTDRRDRVWARVTGALLGYGYRSSRALVYLVGVLALSVTLAVLLGGHGALAPTPDLSPAAAPSAELRRCSTVQLIGKGLDLGIPFLSAARIGAGSCEVTATTTGEALTVARWVLQLAAWALAALFIAGFTGIVRRS